MSTYNFTIKQGETFQTEITYMDSAGSLVDLTNYEACMQVKDSFGGTAILQFLTPNSNSNQIRFGDPQDNGAGYIDYNHNTSVLSIGVNGPEKMRIDNAG